MSAIYIYSSYWNDGMKDYHAVNLFNMGKRQVDTYVELEEVNI